MRRRHLLAMTVACVLLPAAARVAGAGPLRVGAGRAEFTKLLPAPPTPPSGRFEHERLFIRAIVLDDGTTRAALINVDGAAPASGRMRAAEELKCPIENVIISSTHSHSANLSGVPPGLQAAGRGGAQAPAAPATPPGAPAAGGRGAQQPAATSPLDPFVVEAVRQAAANLKEARMGFGTGKSYLNVNRDAIDSKTRQWVQDANLDAPSDKTVTVIKFETPAGEPIAFYMNYAMHPNNLYLGGINSADFPGAAARYIEQIYDDRVVAVFSQGAEGDQNPLYLRASTAAQLERGGQKYTGQPLVREPVEAEIREGRRPMVPLDRKAADAVEKFIEAEGIMFAEEVLRVAHSTAATPFTGHIVGMQKTLTCAGRTKTGGAREGGPATYADGPDVNIQIGMLGIGSVGLPWVNAEVYNLIGQQVKAASPLTKTLFVGLANGQAPSGYIPTDEGFSHQTFQALGSRLKPGCAETGIRDTMVDLLTQYAASSVNTK
jgi:neutral ceramidase